MNDIRLSICLLGVFAMGFIAGCGGGGGISLSDTPEIALVDVSPMTVRAFTEALVFEIKYDDGDGDLGSNEEGVENLFVKDERVDITHAFRIQQLAPEGEEIPITGTLSVELANTILIGNGTSEDVTFSIYVEDRNGNKSNTITTPTITVIE